MSDIQPSAGDPILLRKEARAAYKSGEYDNALELYEQLLARGPDADVKAAAADLLEYGAALGRVERFEDSAAAFRRAVEMTPDDLNARLRLARTLSRLEDHEEAAAHYRVVNEMAPGDPEHMVALASELRWTGESEDARSLLKQVLEIDPNHIEAKLVLLAIGRTTLAPVGPNALLRQPMERERQDYDDEEEERPEQRQRPRGARPRGLPFGWLVVIGVVLCGAGLFIRSLFP